MTRDLERAPSQGTSEDQEKQPEKKTGRIFSGICWNEAWQRSIPFVWGCGGSARQLKDFRMKGRSRDDAFAVPCWHAELLLQNNPVMQREVQKLLSASVKKASCDRLAARITPAGLPWAGDAGVVCLEDSSASGMGSSSRCLWVSGEDDAWRPWFEADGERSFVPLS